MNLLLPNPLKNFPNEAVYLRPSARTSYVDAPSLKFMEAAMVVVVSGADDGMEFCSGGRGGGREKLNFNVWVCALVGGMESLSSLACPALITRE